MQRKLNNHMNFNIKRIKRESLTELATNLTLENYEKLEFFNKNSNEVELSTEDIDGKLINVYIEVDKYLEIARQEQFTKDANKKLAILLFNDLKKLNLPKYVFYQREFWSYMNIFVFKDIIKYLYFDKKFKETEDEKDQDSKLNKYKRYFLNDVSISRISRSGFWFLWHMANKVYLPNEPNLINIAFDFITPVSAMIERNQGKNNDVLLSWLRVISMLDEKYKSKINSPDFKFVIPTHLNNLSVIFSLESLNETLMVETIKKEVIEFIDSLE